MAGIDPTRANVRRKSPQAIHAATEAARDPEPVKEKAAPKTPSKGGRPKKDYDRQIIHCHVDKSLIDCLKRHNCNITAVVESSLKTYIKENFDENL